jgi:hypothetical protein
MAMGVAAGSGLCFGQRESRDVEVLSGFSFQRERGGLRLCLARRGKCWVRGLWW